MKEEYNCVDCKNCIEDYGMWICLNHNHQIDDLDLPCDEFEKGCTLDNSYKLDRIQRDLKNALRYNPSLKNTFLYHQVKEILKYDF